MYFISFTKNSGHECETEDDIQVTNVKTIRFMQV